MNCTIYIDGGARGNPGPAAVGVVIRDTDSKALLHEAGYFLGKATNNVAEYQGLLRSLELAIELNASAAHIHSDSELLVRQINGQYRVKSPDLKPLFEQAKTLLGKLPAWKVTHVRREKNKRADELANLAMDAKKDVLVVVDGAGRSGATEPALVAQEPAPLPCWEAELTGRPKCVTGQNTGNAYTFGPTTPDGFCIYAAAAVLTDGPLQWPAKKRSSETRCQQCGQTVRMTRIT